MAVYLIPNAVEDDARLTRHLRMGYGVLLFAFAVIALASVAYGDRLSGPTAQILAYMGYAILAIGIFGPYFLFHSIFIRKLKKDVRFETTEGGLIRHRVDWTDEFVPFTEITVIYENKKYLQVNGKDRFTRIVIPKEVENFRSLRQELETYCPITEIKTSAFAVDYLSIGPLIAAWLIFFQSTDLAIVKWCGVIGMLILAEQFYCMGQWFKGRQWGFLGWFVLATVWFACAWFGLYKINLKG